MIWSNWFIGFFAGYFRCGYRPILVPGSSLVKCALSPPFGTMLIIGSISRKMCCSVLSSHISCRGPCSEFPDHLPAKQTCRAFSLISLWHPVQSREGLLWFLVCWNQRMAHLTLVFRLFTVDPTLDHECSHPGIRSPCPHWIGAYANQKIIISLSIFWSWPRRDR